MGIDGGRYSKSTFSANNSLKWIAQNEGNSFEESYIITISIPRVTKGSLILDDNEKNCKMLTLLGKAKFFVVVPFLTCYYQGGVPI